MLTLPGLVPSMMVQLEEYARGEARDPFLAAALITAATKSADPLELAAKLLRDRGRISVIGDVGMGVSRATMYRKELSLAMSRSYGPGRYDPRYEEGGQDYPIGFVRWTE